MYLYKKNKKKINIFLKNIIPNTHFLLNDKRSHVACLNTCNLYTTVV